MAKKKSETAAEKAPAAKAPAAKKEPAKRSAAAPQKPASVGAPMIDTSLAANAAAAMIGGKVQSPASSAGAAAAGSGAKKESAAFKQLKAGLNKPSAGALGGAFTPQGQQKKSIVPLGGPRQVGHNQTFGADVNRTGVPRRTPG